MQTRSSRYLDEEVSTKPKLSRSNKNRYLYDEVNAGIGYDEIDNFSNYGEKLDNNIAVRTREDYQKLMGIKPRIDEPKEEEKKEEPRVFDINSALEEAKKNRTIPEEVEKKRNLQNAEYSILADLNKKYLSKKEKEDLEKEGIRELIDTITSKSLPNEIAEAEGQEDDLLSDLMATNTMNAIGSIDELNLKEEIAKEILAEQEQDLDEEDDDEIKKEDGRLVNSFYTRSMDLTEHDFEIKDEIFEESKGKTTILILVVLLIIVAIAIAAVLILKYMGIISF